MDHKNAALRESLLARAAKSKRGLERKSGNRVKRTPGWALELEWMQRLRRVFPDAELPEWQAAERTLAKRLVEELGFERAKDLVWHFLDTWSKRDMGDEAEKGLPGIGLCWAMRARLLAELDGIAKVPLSKAERLREREYDEKAAASHPKFGWGGGS